ncbi:MAG: hypothetical protein ACFFA4_10310 [Promethearchaeota archaeon]
MEENHNKTLIFPSTDKLNIKFSPNRNIGVSLSLVSLLLLEILPIISNSRPSALNALNFAFYLSLWELICSMSLFFYELIKLKKGEYFRISSF